MLNKQFQRCYFGLTEFHALCRMHRMNLWHWLEPSHISDGKYIHIQFQRAPTANRIEMTQSAYKWHNAKRNSQSINKLRINMASKWKIKQCNVKHHFFCISYLCCAIPILKCRLFRHFCCAIRCGSERLYLYIPYFIHFIPCTIWFMCILCRNISLFFVANVYSLYAHLLFVRRKHWYDLIISSWIPKLL